jgi:anaerobic selenocysteine-containing dehydrogenase
MRINPNDAQNRGVRHHDIIRVFNDRGSVLCVADVSPLMSPGMVKTFESCAVFDMFEDPRFGRVDRGGNLNLLTPPRNQVKNTSGMGTNSCLVEIAPWSEPALQSAAE